MCSPGALLEGHLGEVLEGHDAAARAAARGARSRATVRHEQTRALRGAGSAARCAPHRGAHVAPCESSGRNAVPRWRGILFYCVQKREPFVLEGPGFMRRVGVGYAARDAPRTAARRPSTVASMKRWGWLAVAACGLLVPSVSRAQQWSPLCGSGAVQDEVTSDCVTPDVLAARRRERARPTPSGSRGGACVNGQVLDEVTADCVAPWVLSNRQRARATLSAPAAARAPERDYTARDTGIGIASGGYALSVIVFLIGAGQGGPGFALALLPVFGQPVLPLFRDNTRTALSTSQTANGVLLAPAVAMQVSGIALAIAMRQGTAPESARVAVVPTIGGASLGVRF